MTDWVLAHEQSIRLGFFFGVLGVMALWETVRPCRPLSQPRRKRWLNNLGLVALNSLVLRLLFPAAAVGLAAAAADSGWGLLNNVSVPFWIALPSALIALDLGIYLQHVLVHAVPLLWRLHRVHHADLDYDVTTGTRFHPIEIILSMLIKFCMILVLGPPVEAVILFEVILNGCAMFNHGNVRLPPPLERRIRLFVVTPDMHRVHHSVDDEEANSNFGFNLSIWDRFFGTYRDQPVAGHQGMQIGIHRYRSADQCVRIRGMLVMPFLGKVSEYAINRRAWKRRE